MNNELAVWAATSCPAANPLLPPPALTHTPVEQYVNFVREFLATNGDIDGASITYVTTRVPVYLAGPPLCAIVLLAMLPLFISRCCAHKCCTPSCNANTVAKHRSLCSACAWGWFVLLSLALLSFGLVGMFAVSSAPAVVESGFCDFDDTLVAVDRRFDDIASNFTAFRTSLTSILTDLGDISTSLTCVGDFFDPSTGGCTRISAARDNVNNIRPRLPDPNNAAFVELDSFISGIHSTCTGLSSVSTTIDTASSAVDSVSSMVSTFVNITDDVVTIAANTRAEGNRIGDRLGQIINSFPTWLGIVGVFALFTFPVIVNTIALVCSPMTKSSVGIRRGCANQCIGFSWVCGLFVAFLFLLLGPILVLVSYAGLDTVAYIYTPNATQVCVDATARGSSVLGSASIVSTCSDAQTLLDVCWADGNVVDRALSFFGLNFTMASLREQADRLETEFGGVNYTEFDDLSSMTDSVSSAQDDAAPVTAAALGVIDASDATYVDSQLDSLRNSLDAAASSLTTVTPCSSGLSAIQSLVTTLVATIKNVLDYVLELGACGWIRQLWEGTLDSLASVFWTILSMSSWGLFAVSVAYVFYAPAAIVVQVSKGGVGEEPGCPRICRTAACGCRDSDDHANQQRRKSSDMRIDDLPRSVV